MEHFITLGGKGQPTQWCGVTAPYKGAVDLTFKTTNGEKIILLLTCDNARRFCNALHDSLLYFEESGDQLRYKYVDRNPQKLNRNEIANHPN
jgi:hypothetical protein